MKFLILISMLLTLVSCGGGGTPATSSTSGSTAVVTTFAGTGLAGAIDGIGSAASFNSPHSIAADPTGNLYVADTVNNKIRKISPLGAVSTLAGGGGGGPAYCAATGCGALDGVSTAASFWSPLGIAVDIQGNVYVGDTVNNKIRKISPLGVVSTLAGGGGGGTSCFSAGCGALDGMGTAASFNQPEGIAVDDIGNIYVADQANHKIRKITPSGTVTTLAGGGGGALTCSAGTALGCGALDGNGTAASFNQPQGVAVDSIGNVYVADSSNHKIRKISPAGLVSTLAGSGISGNLDGSGTSATFNYPKGIAVDNSGNVYVTDSSNHNIRKITPTGIVSTVAGGGGGAPSCISGTGCGALDGVGTASSFNGPSGIAIDGLKSLYVADQFNHKIRKIQ